MLFGWGWSCLISLGVGVLVGILYASLGVRSPAPPIVALFGLLGIVLGEQGVLRLKALSKDSSARAAVERIDENSAPGSREDGR